MLHRTHDMGAGLAYRNSITKSPVSGGSTAFGAYFMAWELTFALFIVPVCAGVLGACVRNWPGDGTKSTWGSSGVGPCPDETPEAVIRVYAARKGTWKGVFAVHTWITIKRAGANRFDRYEIVGWGEPLRCNNYPADGRWYGNDPDVVLDIRGPRAERFIGKIEAAIASYPYQERGTYRLWPGPNSNTFVAWIARQVPALGLEMPPTAIGKDFLGPGLAFGPTPSGTGRQISLHGLAGAALAKREGFEVHILGATLGVDPEDLAIKLPSVGSIGLRPILTAFRSEPAQRSQTV